MHQGNWSCSGCGAAITALPFEPRSTEGLLCQMCFKSKSGTATKETDSSAASGPADSAPDEAELANEAPDVPPEAYGEEEYGTPIKPGERPKFQGNWQCATCDGPITSLPFQPRDTSNLKCIDCYKRSRA